MTSATETFPEGPFFAEGVDVTKALAKADDLGVTENGHNMNAPTLRAILKAALVGVEPAEQEERGGFVPSDWHQQRYVTRWKETRR